MRKFIFIVIAVVILLILGMFYGIIPTGSLLEDGTETISRRKGVDDWAGNYKYELLQKKAYILSWKDDGHSEDITVTGSITKWNHEIPFGTIQRVNYLVYLKENAWSSYELVSGTGDTSKYLSNPCYDFKPQNPEYPGYLKTYTFTVIGDKYADGAIKVVLRAKFDETPWDGSGSQWFTLASDEAMFYSGYGGLYLPKGIQDGEDRPYDTFEIGQEVDIRVETAHGGYDEEGKPWRVTLNEPYATDWENWDDPDEGGGVVHQQSYENDVTNGHFKFTVTEEMARKSMESADPYTIRIWNVLLPKGSLYVDFLDFIALAPGDVEFDVSAIQAKVGETFSVSLSSESDIGIDYFRVSVIYGTNDVLLPSDPNSKLWLINTVNIGKADKTKCSIPQTVEFKPEWESYVTVHAKAFDVDGRGSVRTRTYTIWAYEENEAPEEVIKDETGEEDYAGGQTPGYMPWDPSGGNWETQTGELKINWLGVLIAFLIVIGMILIGFFFFKQPKMIIIMALAGIILAVLVYVFFFTNMFS